ncbi:Uncharacterized protein Rs2_10913 [Raphanus sativus]|nr:Uncharacterized protein Rs2_10913 [Raphanus sativus]
MQQGMEEIYEVDHPCPHMRINNATDTTPYGSLRINYIIKVVAIISLQIAPRIRAAGRQSFFSGPSRGDKELLHSYVTGVMSSEEFMPEKRKIPTGSNHLHNKR